MSSKFTSNEFKNGLEKLQIHLIDINKQMTDTWNRFFKNVPNVFIHNTDFKSFMDSSKDIQAIVSPANSFGLMDGGYDKAIIDYFGNELQDLVQTYLHINYCGEQPVGTTLMVPIRGNQILLHTPTMRTPEVIKDSRVVYSCMRMVLIYCIRHGIKSVLIPAFGACTGKVDYSEVANMMRLAYEQLMNVPVKYSWNNLFRFEGYDINSSSHFEGYCNNPMNPAFGKYLR